MLVNPEKYSDSPHLESPHIIIETEPAERERPVGSYPLKRSFDVLFSLALLLVFLPAFLLIALAIRMDSRGPVLFRQERLGKGGRRFRLLKFRTMAVDAEEILVRLLDTSPTLRAEYMLYHKLGDDPRVTRVGRFLRKSSLDELPQLLNVLRGEMSVIGPRPYLPRERPQIGNAYDAILRARPGLTGPWQVGGRNRTTFAQRVEMERGYAESCSWRSDIGLLLRTVRAVFDTDTTS